MLRDTVMKQLQQHQLLDQATINVVTARYCYNNSTSVPGREVASGQVAMRHLGILSVRATGRKYWMKSWRRQDIAGRPSTRFYVTNFQKLSIGGIYVMQAELG